MSRTPNPEQKKAIEHKGGVLLSAGAGSGKTFVLVEHVVYLIDQFFKENIFNDNEDRLFKLRTYLSSIVLMTFTNEAAGELSLRVQRRIEEEAKGRGDVHWNVAVEAISALTISTIHGFCFKLLSAGYFTDFNPSEEVIFDIQSSQKIAELFDEWIINVKSEVSEEIYNIVLLNEKNIKSSMSFIFSNPELRLFWEEWEVKGQDDFNFAEHIKEVAFFEGVSLDEASHGLDLSEFEEERKNKWFPYLEEFEGLLSSYGFRDYSTLKAISELDKKYGTVRTPPKKGEITERMKFLTNLKGFVRKYGEDYISFYENRDGIVFEWEKLFKNAFLYISDRYKNFGGITFSDLEYYVLKGLGNEETAQRVSEDFKYLIVDEFQDTSWVQFDIIKKVIANDFSRLFCVGDEKQAIYGFRGGELGVFLECSKNINQSLSLLNNYRSEEKVINFNNVFFDDVFKLGPGFEGDDLHSVEVKYQKFPSDVKTAGLGCVEEAKIEILLDEDLVKAPRISNSEITEIESNYILEKVEKILQDTEDKVCILYKNLKPSLKLISKMIEKRIPFRAQVKITLEEDPVVALFIALVERVLDKKKEDIRLFKYRVDGICTILGIEQARDVEALVLGFEQEQKVYDTYYAFSNFVLKLGIANSNYSNNLEVIRIISLLGRDDFNKILKLIGESVDGSYSVDFNFLNSPRVKIMTAHASKGLEFDHVILGGIHTNGFNVVDTSFIGKLPGSFKWKQHTTQKKPYKAPMYIYENLLSRQKDFSESKRLFYVAGTRAVKGLYFANIFHRFGEVSYLKNSWVDGLRVGRLEGAETLTKEVTHCESGEEDSAEVSTPLFHIDDIGLSKRLLGESHFGLISELSVTKLSSLAECPRKFFLQNICKIDKDFLDDIEGEVVRERIENDDEIKIYSSSQRGSEVHKLLEMIAKKIDIPKIENAGIAKAVKFAASEMECYRENFNFLAEQMVKFPIFGQMISGIADLVLLEKEGDSAEVWDYKTGKLSDDKLVGYWFQLYCYAHAYFGFNKNLKTIKLKLFFVDEEKILEKTISQNEVTQYLRDEWQKLSNLAQVNESHCQVCSYRKICYYNCVPVAEEL